MNDDELLGMVSESMPGVHLDRPVEAIVSRGRSRVRRRNSGLAVAGVAASAAIALPLLSGSLLAGSTGHTGPPASTVAQPGNVHVHLADYSVDSNSDGTVTVTLPKEELGDPAGLRAALTRAGVPAQVRVGEWCHDATGGNQVTQALTDRPSGDGKSRVIVITPSAIPSGYQLDFGIVANPARPGTHRIAIDLDRIGGPLVCASSVPGTGTGK
jgi:hypothetical protein